MTNVWYGDKYDHNEYDATAIAKHIRKDLKAELPGVKTWVRVRKFSMGQAIDVYVDYHGVVTCPECNGQRGPGSYAYDHDEGCSTCSRWAPGYAGRMHPDARVVYDNVRRIVEAYNRDGSDPMTDYYDVKYYAHVELSPPWDAR